MKGLNLPTVDLETAEAGKWFDFNETMSFRIAKDGNAKHKRAVQGKFAQIEKLRGRNDFNRIEALTNELMSKYILKDWKGVTEETDEGTVVLPFSSEVALTILSNPAYEIIKEFVLDCSQSRTDFETGEDELVKK